MYLRNAGNIFFLFNSSIFICWKKTGKWQKAHSSVYLSIIDQKLFIKYNSKLSCTTDSLNYFYIC